MNDVQQLESAYVRTLDDFRYLVEPFVHLAVVLGDVTVLFISPMCGDALFGYVVHSLRANLNFHPHSTFTHQCTVKCLISITFRLFDPVPNPVLLITEKAGDGGEDVIALLSLGYRVGAFRREHYPYGVKVEDLLEGHVLRIRNRLSQVRFEWCL